MLRISLILVMFLPAVLSLAATVDLNDGRVVQGDIVKQDSKTLQINVAGVTMTYYADEIKDIDGKPFSSGPALNQGGSGPAVLVPPTPDTIDPQKRDLILKFLDVFGTRQALNTNFEMMVAQIQKSKPQEADNIRKRVKVDEIIERLLPVYDRNFTTEELKAFIAFYSSPEGQKLITTLPTLMKESVQESIKYMQEKFPEVKSSQ